MEDGGSSIWYGGVVGGVVMVLQGTFHRSLICDVGKSVMYAQDEPCLLANWWVRGWVGGCVRGSLLTVLV